MIEASAVGILAAFGAGIVSFLSPCVAPLLPGYLTLISGSAGVLAPAGGPALAQPTRLRLFWPSLIFVSGFTLVFVSLGAAASVFGDLLRVHRYELARIAGLVMILMGLVVLWGSRAPFLMRERRFHLTPRAFTSSEVLLLGMAFGFGWTPCFGPILASILVYTSTAETVREGTLLLFAYSLGLGLPFLLAGLGLGQLRGVIRAVNRHAGLVIAFSGITMIVIGSLFLTGQMFRLAIAGQRLLSGIGL
ncbi:MAG: cytochrome C biogenesis protein [Chloroflexi bacterium]|nr:MAG: cytochrome C biogenesis protein [Chloroflexota bacterium]